jgi:hypothetical protein
VSIIIKLLSYQIVQGKTVAEGAPLLKRLGLNLTEIAEIFGSTSKAVHTRLSEAKKKSIISKSK